MQSLSLLSPHFSEPFHLTVLYGRKVFFDSIEYLRGHDNYTMIHLYTGEKLLLSKTLLHYERLLSPYGFLRVNKSYLLNSDYIMLSNKTEMIMQSGIQIKISRRRQQSNSVTRFSNSNKIPLQRHDKQNFTCANDAR
jgi:two-component system LytT family response regulator